MIDCAVVQDLLPLYADGTVSTETRKIIGGHLSDCPFCRETLRHNRRTPIAETVFTPPLEGSVADVSRKIRRRRFASAVTFGAVTLAAAYLGAALIFQNRK